MNIAIERKNQFLYFFHIFITPKSWKRPASDPKRGYHRYTTKTQRDYFSQLYAEMLTAGVKPLAGKRLSMSLVFYIKRRSSIPDVDNLAKAILDAGQPTKWMTGNYAVDLWNDNQFEELAIQRVMGADVDEIQVLIKEIY